MFKPLKNLSSIPQQPVAISYKDANKRNGLLPVFAVGGFLVGECMLTGAGLYNPFDNWYDLISGIEFLCIEAMVFTHRKSPEHLAIGHALAPLGMAVANYPQLVELNLLTLCSIPIYTASRVFGAMGELSKKYDYTKNKLLKPLTVNASLKMFATSTTSRCLMLWPALSKHEVILSSVIVIWGIADSFLARNIAPPAKRPDTKTLKPSLPESVL